jgi:hypothetical protein
MKPAEETPLQALAPLGLARCAGWGIPHSAVCSRLEPLQATGYQTQLGMKREKQGPAHTVIFIYPLPIV